MDISIKQQRAEVIIAGGMGPRAIEFFNQLGIEAITGASGRVADVVNSYLKGELKGTKPCQNSFEPIGIYKFNSLPKGISPKEYWMVYLNEVSERRKKKDLLFEERSDEFKSFP